MPTRDDVARLAGVSGATVSYVLNNSPHVSISSATRETVLRTAEKIGYRPSFLARALKMGRTGHIGVLAPRGEMLFSPYHDRILRGVWVATSRHGCRLVIDSIDPQGDVAFADERIVDGIVGVALLPRDLPEDRIRAMVKLKLPIAMVGGGSWARMFNTFDADQAALGNAAARHLIDRGHRRIVFLGASETSEAPTPCQRCRGFRDGAAAKGVTLGDDDFVPTAGAERVHGYDGAMRLLNGPLRFTAIMCFNDNLALGVMRAAGEMGVRVPEDFSVMGVDAIPDGQISKPRLASFRYSLEKMGEDATDLLFDPPARPVHRLYPFELVQGDTVAARSGG